MYFFYLNISSYIFSLTQDLLDHHLLKKLKLKRKKKCFKIDSANKPVEKITQVSKPRKTIIKLSNYYVVFLLLVSFEVRVDKALTKVEFSFWQRAFSSAMVRVSFMSWLTLNSSKCIRRSFSSNIECSLLFSSQTREKSSTCSPVKIKGINFFFRNM